MAVMCCCWNIEAMVKAQGHLQSQVNTVNPFMILERKGGAILDLGFPLPHFSHICNSYGP